MNNLNLYVNMFGEFSISNNIDAMKVIHSKKICLLLSVLIINRGRSISRESLIDLLWHDSDECADPVNALKNLVYRTRLYLNNLFSVEKVNFINFYNDSYMWNTDISCILDTEQMNYYFNCAYQELSKDKKIELLFKAAAVYNGSFLQNFGEEEWVFAKRSYFETVYVKCVIELSLLLLEEYRFKDVISLCEQSVVNCPYQEDIHKILIESYIETKQYSKALVHYENLINLFSKDLGLGVSEEINQLYQKIVKNVYSIETNIDLIKDNLIRKRKQEPFLCDVPVFQQIVNFMLNFKYNRVEKGQFEILVLLTIVDKNGKVPDINKLKHIVTILKISIFKTLRSNDLMSKYSPYQFILAMLVSKKFNIKSLTDRIINDFNSRYNNDDIEIVFEYVKLN